LLQPSEDTVFYLIDSLRPLEVRNVYNGIQIKIICLQTELGIEQKSVPEFEDIFDEDEEEINDEENDDDENDDDDDDRGFDEDDEDGEHERAIVSKKQNKRRRFDPEYLEKLQKRREWEAKRC
jgi:cell division control protein 45